MNPQGLKKIEYLDYTWSPISGCLHGCKYCYMHRMAQRFPQISMEPAFHPERLSEPLRVKKPSIIGVAYSGDAFGKWVPAEWIEQVMDVCRQARWHRFLFLTKNPKRYGEFEIPDNCWCGTSVTGQGGGEIGDEEDNRMEALLELKFKRRFVSIEPFIGDIVPVLAFFVDWVIVGGLTGKSASTPDDSMVWALVELCKHFNKPIFLKSNTGYPDCKKFQAWPEDLKL